MKFLSYFFSAALLFACTGVLSGQSYTDVIGDDITYSEIQETTGGGLFGQPSADGNDLEFGGLNFNLQAVDGAVEFLNGAVSLTATSNSGLAFNSFSLEEFGIFNNTAESVSSVDGFLTVVTDDGIFQDSFSLDFDEGDDFWSGSATVTFPATLQAEIFFQDILFVSAADGGGALVSKNDVRLTASVVPEPVAGLLIGPGFVAILCRRRRV